MKYPRTPHLPWSPGASSDDKMLKGVDHLLNRQLIFTEKADGSNVCLEANDCWARSHASKPNHPSFDQLKSLHATIKHKIPPRTQIFGEWCYAKHSIAYRALPSYLLLFGVLAEDTWAEWGEIPLWAEELGVATVKVLATELVGSPQALQALTGKLVKGPSAYGADEPEGLVVRAAGHFHTDEFRSSIAKWVRAGHVQTDQHWKNQAITRNGLAGQER